MLSVLSPGRASASSAHASERTERELPACHSHGPKIPRAGFFSSCRRGHYPSVSSPKQRPVPDPLLVLGKVSAPAAVRSWLRTTSRGACRQLALVFRSATFSPVAVMLLALRGCGGRLGAEALWNSLAAKSKWCLPRGEQRNRENMLGQLPRKVVEGLGASLPH